MTVMDSAALAVLSLLFLIPLLLGIFSILIKTFPTGRLVGPVLGLSLAELVLLAWVGERTMVLPLSFLGEPVLLSVSNTAVLLYALLVVVLGVLLYINQVKRNQSLSRVETVLLAFSLSFGTLAFFSNQFMIRYIALEIVGLLAALTACKSFERKDFQRFREIFLTLRIGDIGLWGSILIILSESGTLAIPDMVDAAIALPLPQRIWVVVGFILAGVVKMGVIPFAAWQNQAWSGKNSPAVWIPGFLMPGLGMYLLYRIYPILMSSSLFQIGLPILAVILILGQFAIGYIGKQVQPRFVRMGSILNTFVLLIAAQGSGVLLRDDFLALILYRLVVLMQEGDRKEHHKRLIDFFPVIMNFAVLMLHWEVFSPMSRWIWIGLTVIIFVWDQLLIKRTILGKGAGEELLKSGHGILMPLAEKSYQFFEVKLFSQGVTRLADSFSRLINGLHQGVEINVLSHGLVSFTVLFGKAAVWLWRNIELGFDRVWNALGKIFSRISVEWLRNIETGPDRKVVVWTEGVMQSVDDSEKEFQSRPLHRDLIWIPILMLVILGFLFILQGG